MYDFLKKHMISTSLIILLIVVFYVVIGVVAPFMKYKKISTKTKQSITIINDVYQTKETVDRAMLLESNQSAWEERIRLLNIAKERIILSTFDIREGKSTTDLAALLLHKAEEGVKVYLLVDGINGELHMKGNSFFLSLASNKNIEIRFYNPIHVLLPWKTQGRMHDKYVIVDDFAYILGGRNTFDYFIGEYKAKSRSYDREALIVNTKYNTKSRESSLFQVEEYFYSVWNLKETKKFSNKQSVLEKDDVKEQVNALHAHYNALKQKYSTYFKEYDYINNTVPTKGVTLISGDVSIYAKEPKVLYQLCELMSQAKERVLIHTPYAVCNEYMYGELKKVADNVPTVIMMLNSIENGDNFFASSDYRLNKADLIKTGLTLYEYDGGTSYHGKSIVIDQDISIIGSFNFDLRSVYMNTELMLVIRSEELTKELSSYMEAYQNDCRKVINEEEYETPSHIRIEEIPGKRRVAMTIVGRLLQPFRYLL